MRVNHQICRTPLMTAQAPNLRMWYAPNASAADISDTPCSLCFKDSGGAEDFGNAWLQGEVASSEKSLTDCSVSEGVSSVSIHDRKGKTPMVEARVVVGSRVHVKTPNHHYEGMMGVCRGRGHVLLDGKEKCVRILKADLERI